MRTGGPVQQPRENNSEVKKISRIEREVSVMKNRRKILATVLAVAMAAVMLSGISAGANEFPGSIRITSPAGLSLDGQTFEAYRIFDATIGGPDNDRFAYTLVPAFEAFQTANATLLGGRTLREYLIRDDITAEDMIVLSEALWMFISANASILPEGTPSVTGNVATISNLRLGYYLVYSVAEVTDQEGNTVVAAVALTTTKPVAQVMLKADAPTIDKLVWNHHDSYEDWTKWNDVSIGEVVDFRLTSTVPAMTGYSSYTFTIHDRMSAGLTPVRDAGGIAVSVSVGTAATFTSFTVIEGVTHPGAGDTPCDCTFRIVFDPDVFVTLTPGLPIIISYSAVLNENANVGPAGNPNDARLEYSRTPYEAGDGEPETNWTPWERVKVYTGEMGFIKVDGDNVLATLPGAQFELWDEKPADGGARKKLWFTGPTRREVTEQIVIEGVTETVVVVINEYKVAPQGPGTTDRLTTPDYGEHFSGRVVIRGLGASYTIGTAGDYDIYGSFSFVEVVAPNGYYPLEGPILVQLRIDCVYDGEWTPYQDTEWELAEWAETPGGMDWVILQGLLRIDNFSDEEFPETGGIGQRIFIIAGASLMGLSLIGLVLTTALKKKKAVKS